MAKIVFIDVNTGIYQQHPNQIKSGPVILATIAKRAGHSVSAYCTDVSIDWNSVRQADLMMVSSNTASAPYAYKLGRRLKMMKKKAVLGGIHATLEPEEALLHYDYVARGEGEPVLLDIIDAVLGKKELGNVASLSWLDGETIQHNPKYTEPVKLDQVRDFSLIKPYQNNQHNRARIIMFSRGCPYSCRFCCIKQIAPGKVRFASIELILKELHGYKGDVVIADDNFYLNPDYAIEVLRHLQPLMANRKLTIQGPVNIAFDDNIIAALKAFETPPTLILGIESCNDDTLNDYKKPHKVNRIKEALSRLWHERIPVLGEFILGSDSDGPDCVQKTVDFAIENHIQYMLLYALIPFPKTEIREQLKAQNRLLPFDWAYHDFHHVTFLPKHITPLALQNEIWKGNNRFYGRPGYIFRNFHHIYKYPLFYLKTGLTQLKDKRIHPLLIKASQEYYKDNELLLPC